MCIKKPYIRTCRQFTDGSYANSGKSKYMECSYFAEDASHYTRAFSIIQKDLLNLFDYIEPSDINLKTYSYRVHELLLRASVEVEANFKAILRENGYCKQGNWNIDDYMKVNDSHFLSAYEIVIPNWYGSRNSINPFESFKEKKSPEWYKAYNATKHDRHQTFQKANFENLIGAVAGLLVLLSSQFYTNDFSSGETLLAIGSGSYDGTEAGIGSHFRIRFPKLSEKDCYDFGSEEIVDSPDFFVKYNYSVEKK